MATPRVLSFDPSVSAFGWGLIRNPRGATPDLVSGTIRAGSLDKLLELIPTLIDEEKPNLIAFERALPYVQQYQKQQLDWGGNAQWTPNPDAFVLQELQGALRLAAIERNIPYLAVAPETWRAAILGKGRMKRERAKAEAKTFVVERLKIGGRISVDACEAICVGLWACSTIEYRNVAAKL